MADKWKEWDWILKDPLCIALDTAAMLVKIALALLGILFLTSIGVLMLSQVFPAVSVPPVIVLGVMVGFVFMVTILPIGLSLAHSNMKVALQPLWYRLGRNYEILLFDHLSRKNKLKVIASITTRALFAMVIAALAIVVSYTAEVYINSYGMYTYSNDLSVRCLDCTTSVKTEGFKELMLNADESKLHVLYTKCVDALDNEARCQELVSNELQNRYLIDHSK